MSPQRLARLAALAAVALTVAACPGAPASPELSDPREILGRTIAATAGLRTMHVRLDAESRSAGPVGQVPQGLFIEGDVDLPAGQFSARGGARDGMGAFAMILAGGGIFVQNGNDERWTRMPMVGLDPAMIFGGLGGLGGQAPDFLGIITDVAVDARTGLELRAIEACETGRCYRTALVISREQVWPLVVKLLSLDRFPGGAMVQPPADQLPSIAIEMLTDTVTERLVDLVGSVTAAGTTVSLGLRISAPNQPVQIQPPPDALVDEFGGFGP